MQIGLLILDEVQAFSYGKHDDQVDAFVQLLDEFEKDANNNNFLIEFANALNKSGEQSMQPTTAYQLCQQARKAHKGNPWRKPSH